MRLLYLPLIILSILCSPPALSQETIELDITTIRGNKELPKILFVVPWQDIKHKKSEQQQLVLHSLSKGLFDPINPNDFTPTTPQQQNY